MKEKKITLICHITDGGAVYLTENHDFSKTKLVIRLDGGAELVRCGYAEEDFTS